jgi:hypothetical protein
VHGRERNVIAERDLTHMRWCLCHAIAVFAADDIELWHVKVPALRA